MVSFVAVTTFEPDFCAVLAVERLGGGVGAAGSRGGCSWGGSRGVLVCGGGGASFFAGAGGEAGTAFLAGAFGRGGFGLAGVGLAASRSAFCCSDCHAGMWEAALLARSFFDSGCLE